MFNRSFKQKLRQYYLQPGYIYVASEPAVISTVVGSSVAVTLYDRRHKVGGMNHFQMPMITRQDQATGRYGNAAIIGLLQMMLGGKGRRRNLEAQIFGGANPGDPDIARIGRENIAIARKGLAERGIHISAEDVDGQLGRKIIFNTKVNEISILKVKKLRKEDWYPYGCSW